MGGLQLSAPSPFLGLGQHGHWCWGSNAPPSRDLSAWMREFATGSSFHPQSRDMQLVRLAECDWSSVSVCWFSNTMATCTLCPPPIRDGLDQVTPEYCCYGPTLLGDFPWCHALLLHSHLFSLHVFPFHYFMSLCLLTDVCCLWPESAGGLFLLKVSSSSPLSPSTAYMGSSKCRLSNSQ